MYLVYLLPILLIVIVAMAIFAGPVLAVVAAVLFMVGLGVYKFLGPGTEPEHGQPPDQAAAPARPGGRPATTDSEEEDTGAWGETWPEQSR